MKFNRTHYIEDVKPDMIDQEVILGGWVEDLRKMGKMTLASFFMKFPGVTSSIMANLKRILLLLKNS